MSAPGPSLRESEWRAEAEVLQAKLLLAATEGPMELRGHLLERLVPRDFLNESMREAFAAAQAHWSAAAPCDAGGGQAGPGADPAFDEMIRRLVGLAGALRTAGFLRQAAGEIEARLPGFPDCQVLLEKVTRECSAELARLALLKASPKVWRNSMERTVDLIQNVEDIYFRRDAKGMVEWAGFPSLNDLTGRLQPGRLFLIGAAPGAGKTAFLAGLARRVAHGKGRVGMIALRDSEENLSLRIFTGESGVHPLKLRKRELAYDDFTQMTYASAQMADCLPAVASLPHAGMGEVSAFIRQICAVKRLELLLIDDLEVCSAVPGESSGEFLAKINQFGQLARELNVPLVGAVALDAVLSLTETEGRPMKELLRISHADFLALLQGKAGDEFGSHELVVLRNALGPTATVPLFFNQTTQHYWEIKE